MADDPPRCSFCNKSQEDVRKLIAGPAVFICDECVQVCSEIIAEDGRFPARVEINEDVDVKRVPEAPVSGPAVRCALCSMPTPVDDGVWIRNRGLLCPGCIGEIEAAVAESSRQGS